MPSEKDNEGQPSRYGAYRDKRQIQISATSRSDVAKWSNVHFGANAEVERLALTKNEGGLFPSSTPSQAHRSCRVAPTDC
jgi:hypothetical protein